MTVKITPNEVRFTEEYAFMDILHKGEIYEVRFDIEDVDRVQELRWHINDGYVCSRSIKGEKHYLHRWIMEPADDKVIDHDDRDKLNNRRSNLIECTMVENNRNKPTRNRHSAYYIKEKDQWRAEVSHRNKNLHLGYFDTKEEAVKRIKEVKKNIDADIEARKKLGIL
jgi:hypothetical protein